MFSENKSITSRSCHVSVEQCDTVLLSYRGKFKEQTSTYILNWIDRFLTSNPSVSRTESKKIFKIGVELIQNLIHHSTTSDSLFVFSQSESKNRFTLCSSNLVDSKQAKGLVSAIDTIRNISNEELRSLKRDVLDSDRRSEHGGGGMGLLELAKLSNGNIDSKLLPSQQDKMLFCLSVHLKTIKD